MNPDRTLNHLVLSYSHTYVGICRLWSHWLPFGMIILSQAKMGCSLWLTCHLGNFCKRTILKNPDSQTDIKSTLQKFYLTH